MRLKFIFSYYKPTGALHLQLLCKEDYSIYWKDELEEIAK